MRGHYDVAAYALGVLEEPDCSHFEEHLATCDACAEELESMLPVVDLLADVDVGELDDRRLDDDLRAPDILDDLPGGRRSPSEPELPSVPRSIGDTNVRPLHRSPAEANGRSVHRKLQPAAKSRARSGNRHLVGLAAAFLLLAALTGGAFVAGGKILAPDSTSVAQPQPSPTDNPSELLPPDGGPGIGGPNSGGALINTDPRTGVQAVVRYTPMAWGTKVSYAVSRVTGPKRCQLVAVRTDGQTEVLATWTVDKDGYGTTARPTALAEDAQTYLPRDQIAAVQVQEVDPSGAATKLVTVPD